MNRPMLTGTDPNDPGKRLLETAQIYMRRPSFAHDDPRHFEVRFTRDERPGSTPDNIEGSMPPYSLVINTADKRLWLSDGEGKFHEYRLEKVNEKR